MATAGKICGLCNLDCSGKPRIKDPSGRYFCKACYTQAIEAQHQKAATPAPTPADLDDFLNADDGEPFTYDFGDVLPAAVPAAAASDPAAPPRICPDCNAPLSPGATLCTSCGFNLNSGEQTAVREMATPMPPAPMSRIQGSPLGGTAWPTVIGCISLLVFAGDALLIVADVAGNPSRILRLGLAIVLAVYLLMGSISLLKRQSIGVDRLRRWAAIKLLAGIVCVGLPLAMVVAAPGASDAFGEALDTDGPVAPGIIIAVLVFMLVWYVTWPICLLAWFARPKITAQTARW